MPPGFLKAMGEDYKGSSLIKICVMVMIFDLLPRFSIGQNCGVPQQVKVKGSHPLTETLDTGQFITKIEAMNVVSISSITKNPRDFANITLEIHDNVPTLTLRVLNPLWDKTSTDPPISYIDASREQNIEVSVNLTCSDENHKKITFIIPIEDENTEVPFFEKEVYDLSAEPCFTGSCTMIFETDIVLIDRDRDESNAEFQVDVEDIDEVRIIISDFNESLEPWYEEDKIENVKFKKGFMKRIRLEFQPVSHNWMPMSVINFTLTAKNVNEHADGLLHEAETTIHVTFREKPGRILSPIFSSSFYYADAVYEGQRLTVNPTDILAYVPWNDSSKITYKLECKSEGSVYLKIDPDTGHLYASQYSTQHTMPRYGFSSGYEAIPYVVTAERRVETDGQIDVAMANASLTIFVDVGNKPLPTCPPSECETTTPFPVCPTLPVCPDPDPCPTVSPITLPTDPPSSTLPTGEPTEMPTAPTTDFEETEMTSTSFSTTTSFEPTSEPTTSEQTEGTSETPTTSLPSTTEQESSTSPETTTTETLPSSPTTLAPSTTTEEPSTEITTAPTPCVTTRTPVTSPTTPVPAECYCQCSEFSCSNPQMESVGNYTDAFGEFQTDKGHQPNTSFFSYYPDPYECTKYHICSKVEEGEDPDLGKRSFDCPPNTIFCPPLLACVSLQMCPFSSTALTYPFVLGVKSYGYGDFDSGNDNENNDTCENSCNCPPLPPGHPQNLCDCSNFEEPFEDPNHCDIFHKCQLTQDGGFIDYPQKCKAGMMFCPLFKTCVSYGWPGCACPTTKTFKQCDICKMGKWENFDIFLKKFV